MAPSMNRNLASNFAWNAKVEKQTSYVFKLNLIKARVSVGVSAELINGTKFDVSFSVGKTSQSMIWIKISLNNSDLVIGLRSLSIIRFRYAI